MPKERYKLVRIEPEATVVADLSLARGFFPRLIGLLGRSSLEDSAGLLIEDCNNVHMFFMRFPLDIVFCRRDGTILHLQPGLKPWRISHFVTDAYFVVELPVGAVERHQLEVGQTLKVRRQAE